MHNIDYSPTWMRIALLHNMIKVDPFRRANKAQKFLFNMTEIMYKHSAEDIAATGNK